MKVKAERDGRNRALQYDAPPVLPKDLVIMRTGVFIKDILKKYRYQVCASWSPEDVEKIESDHGQLLEAYVDDDGLRKAIASCDHTTSFDDAWNKVKGCDHLRGFCGGLATAFANTTSVESDFSILKWEMDDNRTSMMHLSVEGVFQAKQRAILDEARALGAYSS